MTTNAWLNFKGDQWQKEINVRDFIQQNYLPYEGDSDFLVGPTTKTSELWQQCLKLLAQEHAKGGVLDVDTDRVMNVTSHPAGYIDRFKEVIVGLQTDAPLKRGVITNGGIRMAEQACEAYGYKLNPNISDIYHNHCLTHNTSVFNVYTEEMLKARKLGIITGLPDAYGRGRIIGDYRRVALYGIDRLIEAKQQDHKATDHSDMTESVIREREEIAWQIKSLHEIKEMAQSYGIDISKPATNAKEAVQWLYFAYLAAIKGQNGAAMSFGRTATFIDIYIERDLQNGLLNEEAAQELMDQLVIKLRLARHLRTPDYNDLFAGDPLWVTEVIGGMGEDGRTLVTKNSFRFLHTLYNLGPAPEPNLTILWSENLPEGFKKFCAKLSIDTSSVQYENDEVMRPVYGDDYGIACCVSAMKIGKQMQFFGARVNLAKALLLAINNGRDEKTGEQLAPEIALSSTEYLDYDEVRAKYSEVLSWLASLYVNTLNVIHRMHDTYAYETAQMALHDSQVGRLMAFGIAGLSVAADSLSAIRYAKVKPIRNQDGLAIDFETKGTFPCFGNNEAQVDLIAKDLVHEFMTLLRQHKTYRDATHTLSVLTITSNVVYGKKTGATPDGRKAGEPFAPGANPMHGRDQKGALAAIASVTQIDYTDCRDGISYTFSIIPAALGKSLEAQINNMIVVLDTYSVNKGHHININVFNREVLIDAMNHPELYPQLTIRVSGYAVNFIKLSPAHQKEVLRRTFYEAI